MPRLPAVGRAVPTSASLSVRGRRACRATLGAVLLAIAASLAGCTETISVDAPYAFVWERSTQALKDAGYEMVTTPDETHLVPPSSERTGRAWFLGGARPDAAGWEAPRVIKLVIDPVEPRITSPRRVTVDVEKRDWVVHARVPDPEMRERIVWILRRALEAPDEPRLRDP